MIIIKFRLNGKVRLINPLIALSKLNKRRSWGIDARDDKRVASRTGRLDNQHHRQNKAERPRAACSGTYTSCAFVIRLSMARDKRPSTRDDAIWWIGTLDETAHGLPSFRFGISFFHLPSSVFRLPSSFFVLRSSFFVLPSFFFRLSHTTFLYLDCLGIWTHSLQLRLHKRRRCACA